MDHYPLFLTFDVFVRYNSRPFRFLNCWCDHPNFYEEVRLSWEEPLHYITNPTQCMMVKLQRLKKRLTVWNWQVFGNMDTNVMNAQANVVAIQKQMQQHGYSDKRNARELNAITRFSQALYVLEKFYKDKVGNQWLELGDRCTQFSLGGYC